MNDIPGTRWPGRLGPVSTGRRGAEVGNQCQQVCHPRMRSLLGQQRRDLAAMVGRMIKKMGYRTAEAPGAGGTSHAQI